MAESPDLIRRNFLLGRFAVQSPEPARPIAVVIGQSCFAFQGIACMSCRDACLAGAVRFELAIGGARPKIMTDACTGCGDCSRSCPANAIELSVVEGNS